MMNQEDLERAIKYGTEWLKDEYLDARDGAFIEIALEALKREPCENAISREDAIIRISWDFPTLEISKVKESLDKLPSVNPQSCEDAISRQYLIDIATEDGAYDYVSAQEIANAPSVNPQPKTGEWIIIDDCEQFIAKCSECGRIEDSRMISKYPYCHCGAKMSKN